jgi:PAS domain S-box-containing protein
MGPRASKPSAHPKHGLERVARSLLQWSRDGVVVCDPSGRIAMANRAAADLLGYEAPEELCEGRTVEEIFQNPEEVAPMSLRAEPPGSVREFDTYLAGKNGRVVGARVRLAAIGGGGGGVRGHILILRDISEQVKAKQELDRQSARLATLSSIATTLTSSLDLREVLERTIDEILKLLQGASIRIYVLEPKGEWLNLVAWRGASSAFIDREHFQRRRVGDGLLGRTVLHRRTIVVDNFLRADDPYVEDIVQEGLISSVYIPLMAKEKPVGVLCVSSYEEFRFSPDFVEFLTAVGNQIGVALENANLYEGLKEAYEELRRTQEQLLRSEKLASLGKLAATIAHEINNPLSVVLTYTKLMKNMLQRGAFTPKRLSDISRFLATMESETAHCGEIVRNLLAFARHSALDMAEHRVEEIIQRTVALIAHDLEMKEMRLGCSWEPGLPPVKCDFRQIQQAMLNLMINGIEAMGKGGLLTVEARRAPREGFVQLSVSDTGCGIPEEKLSQIFEPFFTTKEEAKGVGLGLSVVYGIITRHGGSIEVESRVGEGTTFRVFLPCASGQQGALAADGKQEGEVP